LLLLPLLLPPRALLVRARAKSCAASIKRTKSPGTNLGVFTVRARLGWGWGWGWVIGLRGDRGVLL
jgi:hypothetical protein